MALKSAPYYWLECDDCGGKSTEGGEYAAWADHGGACDDAINQEWYCQDGHDWCEECRIKHLCAECDKVTVDLTPLKKGSRWRICAECKAANHAG